MNPADKIRKLIRLADNSSQEDAQAALIQAQAIAAKYHIDMASMPTEDADPHEMRDSTVELWGKRKKQYRWELAHVVASAHGCAPWFAKRLTAELERPPDQASIDSMFAFGDESLVTDITTTPSGTTRILATWCWRVGPKAADITNRCSAFQQFGVISAERVALLVMVGRREAAQAAIYVYNMLLRVVDETAAGVARGRSGLNSARWGVVRGLQDRLVPDEDRRDGPKIDLPSSETALVLSKAVDSSTRFLEDAFGDKPFSGSASGIKIRDPHAFGRGLEASAEIEIPDPNAGRASLRGGRELPLGKDRQLGEDNAHTPPTKRATEES